MSNVADSTGSAPQPDREKRLQSTLPNGKWQTSEIGLSGRALIGALKQARIEFVVALPDATMSENVLWPLSQDKDFKLVRVCKEDEGVSICAGMTSCGRRAVLLMQYTGLLDSINAIRVIAVEIGQPICMVVGLLSKEPGIPVVHSKIYSVRIVEPILGALGIDHFCMEGPADVAMLAPAIDRAYARSQPLCALVGHRVAP
jgi:sulfopyruvate decarboxylase TPP-binding subunit